MRRIHGEPVLLLNAAGKHSAALDSGPPCIEIGLQIEDAPYRESPYA
jgi:hypothetical protein